MALARARRDRGVEYWPGFVDALSTLVLGIVFLLSVFVVMQFFLSQEVTGKDIALARLNSQIAQLTELLSLEKTGKVIEMLHRELGMRAYICVCPNIIARDAEARKGTGIGNP